MPEQSHPPYAAGALIVPRLLNRWLDVNSQNSKLERIRKYVVLPTFNIPTLFVVGYDYIVGEFHYEAPKNFSFTSRFTVYPQNLGFSIMVSWVDVNFKVYRYRLYRGVNEHILMDIPDYSGQLVKKNFRIEIWAGQVDIVPYLGLGAPINLFTTVLGDFDYRYAIDTPLVGDDGLCTGQQYQAVDVQAITADNTIITADNLSVRADNEQGGSQYPLPMVWGVCTNPIPNPLSVTPVIN